MNRLEQDSVCMEDERNDMYKGELADADIYIGVNLPNIYGMTGLMFLVNNYNYPNDSINRNS
jgi:hypothetical protein